MMFSKVRILALVSAVAVVHSAAVADTVTLAPPSGVTTNVLSLITGNTAVEVAGPGTVKLNNSNLHTGGTTLSGGTLVISGNIPAGGPSPVGTGTFTVSGGTLRGTGTFGGNITGTGAATVEAPDGWTWSGDNTFSEALTISEGTIEVAGGTTTLGKHLYLLPVGDEPVCYLQSGGSVTMGANNLQFSYKAGSSSSFTMTGGSFDVNGNNALVGYNVANASATVDISGGAALRNIGNFYTHTKSGNSLAVSVRDGGTLGFGSIYNSSSDGTLSLHVDGGTLANDTTGISSARTTSNSSGWIRDNITSFKVGPGGATFTTDNGAGAGLAQIRMPILAEAAGEGGTAKGVTFKTGNWGYYVAGNDYEGPTVIRNGAALFLYSNGTIPSGSVVTVASGGELCVCGAANKPKTVSSLVLQNGAILGFGSNLNTLTASGSVTLPSHAKIALYNNANPTTGKNNDNGTYVVLKVPAAYEAALRAVHWSCATATSGKSYTFSVATSGETATLSMTIAAASSAIDAAATSGGYGVVTGDLVVDTDIEVRGTLVVSGNVIGSATGGKLTIHDGGTLRVETGYIRPVSSAGYSFDLYLEKGGSIIVRSIEDSQSLRDADQTGPKMFHFNGGTIYPVGLDTASDGNRFYLNYQPATIGERGLVIDLAKWERPKGYVWYSNNEAIEWVRASVQGKVNHDQSCADTDGGITVRGISGDRSLVLFGGRFKGSTLNGGIRVESGATAVGTSTSLDVQTISFAPGSRFRPYDNKSTMQIGNLTLGEAGATEPVAFDGSSNKALYNVFVSGTLSVLSPVEFSVAPGWNYDSTVSSGTYTALVYQASCSVDPSLFRLPANAPAGATLSAQEVTLAGGDYAGCKALVVTIANDIVVTGSTSYPTPLTVSEDAAVGSIVVGGAWNGEADPVCETSLTISGNVTASEGLYLGYNPAPGVDKDNWHKGFLALNGGSITTPLFYSIYRPGMTGNNDSDCRFGCEATVNDGLLDVAGDVRLGYNRSRNGDNLYSRLTVNAGRVAVGGKFYLLYDNTQGAFTAPGSIVLNGGEVDVKGVIDMSRNAQNPGNLAYNTKFGIWLNGGVLKAENIMMTATSATTPQVVFNGGTYAPYGTKEANRTMSYPNKVYVSAGGAVISTENIPADATYTIAQPLLTDPALDGAADGGLVKKGAGTLALSGANTFTGPVKVEAGTLGVANADALSGSVEVADGAVLDLGDLGETGASVASIAASGAVAGKLTVTDAIVLGDEGSVLSVNGDLALGKSAVIDFGLGEDEEAPSGWTPVAAAFGTITVPERIKVRNAGANFTRADTCVIDGVLYAKPTTQGLMLIMR